MWQTTQQQITGMSIVSERSKTWSIWPRTTRIPTNWILQEKNLFVIIHTMLLSACIYTCKHFAANVISSWFFYTFSLDWHQNKWFPPFKELGLMQTLPLLLLSRVIYIFN